MIDPFDSLLAPVRHRVDDAEWSELLASDPRSTEFHAPWFASSMARHHPGWKPCFLELRDESGRLVAGLPFLEQSKWGMRTWVSGFAGSYGGPVAAPDRADSEEELARSFHGGGVTVVRREMVWGRIEAPRGEWRNLQPLDTSVLSIDPAVSFEQFLLDQFPKNRRNEANRSDRRGMQVEIDATGESLEPFYAIYAERCAHWKSPAVAIGALRDVLNTSAASALFVAKDADGQVLGGHVVVDLGDELFAWVGTTARHRELFPATVLIREEARWCHERGRVRLNLGASLGLSGVENYKKLLGAHSSPRWILREDRLGRWRGRRS